MLESITGNCHSDDYFLRVIHVYSSSLCRSIFPGMSTITHLIRIIGCLIFAHIPVISCDYSSLGVIYSIPHSFERLTASFQKFEASSDKYIETCSNIF